MRFRSGIFLCWRGKPEDDLEKGQDREKVRQVFDPTGSPFERGEGNKEDPLTFRLALNEG